ncbi:MAG TPA: energy-coupling factor ABC transporter substrate-binding protein [Negativicutes bacterium]|nr:energy-coupling factor ABC transporter substrate-binding protein [Negativicutes bacterium]
MITRQNLLLLLLAAALALVPLALAGDFAGTDDQAAQAIGEIRPGYTPWFTSLWEPSDKTIRLLFGLQAASGVAFIAYFLRRHRRPAD